VGRARLGRSGGILIGKPSPVYHGRAAICREVLESLPEWFGIPASIERYVAAADELPMLACFAADEVVGFVSVKTHTAFAAEVYVMAPSSLGIDAESVVH
jgi:hypothetical protein